MRSGAFLTARRPRRVIGNSLGTVSFTAWGIVRAPYAPPSLPFAFAGGIWDLDAGLVRFGARDYSPYEGRWRSKDPVRFGGGYDLFAYCSNDPVNCLDSSGLRPGDPYSSRDAAEADAAADLIANSVGNGWEWFAWVYELKDGRFTYEVPVTSHNWNHFGAEAMARALAYDRSALAPYFSHGGCSDPSSITPVADIHNHPYPTQVYGPSAEDIDGYDYLRSLGPFSPGYTQRAVVDPAGGLWNFGPSRVPTLVLP